MRRVLAKIRLWAKDREGNGKRAKFDLDIIGKKFGKYDQTFGIHTHEGPCTFCPIGGLAFGP